MIEIWKPIKGWEGRYEVSNLGGIRRISIVVTHHPSNSGDPYRRTALCREEKAKTVRIHLLVAAAFLGEKPKGHIVNHKDGDKLNCAADNLEYVTHSGNCKHAHDLGLSQNGERHHRAKLSAIDVISIRNKRKTGWTQEALAKQYQVNRRTIRSILTGQSWKRV